MNRTGIASRLIVAVLLLQALLAPAHCLATSLGRLTVVEICTEGGLHLRRLPAEDDRSQPSGAPTIVCAIACWQGIPVAPLALPEPPAWEAAADDWTDAPHQRLADRARASPFEPRGPPLPHM